MHIYRDLLFNNVCSFIDFSLSRGSVMLPELKWQELLSEFFQKAQCRSPLYNDISLEFREYLTDQQHPILQNILGWLSCYSLNGLSCILTLLKLKNSFAGKR